MRRWRNCSVKRFLNIDFCFHFREIDLRAGEQFSPHYVAMNPQHTVPTLCDDNGGAVIWDSHAICTYLIGRYGGVDHPLYPADLVMRARIDQRLHFNNGILFGRLKATFRPFLYDGAVKVSADSLDESLKALAFLEAFLAAESGYLVGNKLTVADLVIYPSVMQLRLKVPLNGDGRHSNILSWSQRMAEELPYLRDTNDVLMMNFSRTLEEIIARNRDVARLKKQ